MSFSGQLEIEEVSPKYRAVSLAYAVAALAIGAMAVLQTHVSPDVSLPAFASFLIASVFYVRWARQRAVAGLFLRRRAVNAVVDERTVVVDGRVIPRAHVLGASTEGLPDGRVRVTLSHRRRQSRLVADTATAAAFLDAIGFPGGSASTTTTFRPSRRALAALLLMVPVIVVFNLFAETVVPPAVVGALGGGLIAAAMLAVCRVRITVGSDGISLARTFSRRFIRYDELESVQRKDHGVTLVLQSGERVVALPRLGFGRHAAHADEESSLTSRIGEATRAHEERTRMRRAADVSRVARGARSASEWVSALQALGAGATSYREGAASPDALARMVEDPAANIDVRIGAAVALRVSGDGAAEQRIRIAAAATAEAGLRGALESVLADDGSLEERVAKMRVLSETRTP